MRAGYPQCYHKTDKEGRPILLDMVGRVDATKLRESTDYERLTKFRLHRMEHNLQVKYPICSEVAGRPVGESVIIIDLKGFRPSQFALRRPRPHAAVLQDPAGQLPRARWRMFVINAPALFAGVWLVVKNFVDVRTRSKVDILGSKYTAKLLEVVDRSVLPTIFGGDDDSLDLSRDQGPWMGRAPPPPLVRVVSASPETVSPASQADSARASDGAEAVARARARAHREATLRRVAIVSSGGLAQVGTWREMCARVQCTRRTSSQRAFTFTLLIAVDFSRWACRAPPSSPPRATRRQPHAPAGSSRPHGAP